MMKSIAALAGALMILTTGAMAAPLTFTRAVSFTDPTIIITDTVLEFEETTSGGVTTGDALVIGATIDSVSGVILPSDATFDLFFNFNVDDGSDFDAAFFISSGLGADLLSSANVSAFGTTEDQIEIVFGMLTGDLAAQFPNGIVVLITFIDALGLDPLAALVAGTSYTIDITLASAVPLPAALPLFAGGLALVALVRRRRAAKA